MIKVLRCTYRKIIPSVLRAKIWLLKEQAFSILQIKLREKKGLVLVHVMEYIDRKRDDFIYKSPVYDYVRWSSLELVAHEIAERNIHGCVAELGVYEGEFAELINISFPDRKCYLFDTFYGFDKKDTDIEDTEKYSGYRHDFSNTTIELVLSRMKYPDNVIIKQGYFPDTAKDIDETFAFVNIDADLFQPCYNGLLYFYPKLAKGGYIFVHDYNEKFYCGAREAVKKFSQEYGVPYFPLSDKDGSAVFIK
jgi:O-methyltransferase